MQNIIIPLTKVNKRKLRRTMKKARAILILIGLILLVSQAFSFVGNTVSTYVAAIQNPEEVVVPDKYEEVVITIVEGDRAWNIQSRLTPNEDVREALYYVELINGKSVGNIQPGEEIVFLGLANE